MTGKRRGRSKTRAPRSLDRPLSHSHTQRFGAAVLLFFLSLAVFWPSRGADFVWDDQPYNLAGNDALMRGDYVGFWTRPYRDFYIPVAYTAWTAVAQVTKIPDRPDGGLEPESFRTINLILHATNTVLVFLLTYSLVGSVLAAATGAMLFSVHPLQVESVVWISELRGLLASFFSLIALILYRRYRVTGSRRVALAVTATVSFGLSILTKPSTTMLPLMAVTLDFLFHRAELPRRWWVVPSLWAVLAIPIMIVAKGVQPDIVVEYVPSLIGRVAVAADALVFYAGKLFVPWPLSPSYGRTPQTVAHWQLSSLLWPLPFVIGFAVWRNRRRLPAMALSVVIGLSALLPVLGLVPFKGQNFSTVADRYMYFPLAGAALAIASWIAGTKMTRARWSLVFTILIALTALNVQYQASWRNEISLWRHAANVYPHQARVHNNYGAALQVAGQQEDAIAQFDLALQARPDFADAYCNRGSSLGRLHRYEEALSDENRAIQLDPTDGACWYNRATTLFYLGRYFESQHDLVQAETRGYQPPAGFADAVERGLRGR